MLFNKFAKIFNRKNRSAEEIAADLRSLQDLRPQFAALHKSQGVIEFNTDGTVITANPNFLKLMGYTLGEIKGKHHRMFVDPAQHDDQGYRKFWEDLAGGQFQEAEFKRITKGGNDVWIRASYNPILNPAGKTTKIVKFATDVTTVRGELEDLRDEMLVRARIMNETSIVSEADLKGNIISTNDKFIEVSQYSRDELIGKPHNTTRHPDMSKETFKQVWSTIGRGNMFRGVIKNRAKDGTPYYVDAVIAPIMGKNGKPRKYLGVRYDITKTEIERHNMKGMLDALNKSYIVVEFDLKGNVLTANDLFLTTMGRSITVIKGQHHSMFFDAADRNSQQLRTLWDKLGRGEYEAGQYKHISQSGKVIWLQASYNPVCDEMGRPFKVVSYATDITVQVEASEALQVAVAQMQDVVAAALNNDLSKRTPMEGKTGQIASLCLGVNGLLDSMSDIVNNLIAGVASSTSAIAGASRELAVGNMSLSQRTEEQAASLEETAASLEEFTATVKQNAENAQKANDVATAASHVAIKGGQVVSEVITTMDEISQASRKIADIISVMDEISFQTNILALNAAVEAARAGEQGRGFAVVASEVRSLAQRSTNAAKEIKSLISDSVTKVESGSKLVQSAGKTMEELVSGVQNVSTIMSEISAASREQSEGIEQVNTAVMQMDKITQQNAALVEEAAAAAKSMEEQTTSLESVVSTFLEKQGVGNQGTERSRHASATGNPVVDRAFRGATLPSKAANPKFAKHKLSGTATTAKRRVAGGGNSDGSWSEF